MPELADPVECHCKNNREFLFYSLVQLLLIFCKGPSSVNAQNVPPGACNIKLIMVVIYGFCNKLECFSLNARLSWKGLPGINTLAHYGNRKLWL